MKSADLRFAKIRKSATSAAAEFDGAMAKTLKTLPSKHALRRARRLAMLRMKHGQIALRRFGSQSVQSLERGAVKGRAIATEAVSAARTFKRKLLLEIAPEMLWLRRRRETLNNLAKALGVGACLWLMIWLWGRPRADLAKPGPAAASTTAIAPVTQGKPADARTPDDAATEIHGGSPGVQGGSADGAADLLANGVADGADGASRGAMQRVASQMTAGKGRDYTAPPWTKWYDEDAESQGPNATSATGTSSGADSAAATEPVSAKKSGGR
jgi:hypothetical protein